MLAASSSVFASAQTDRQAEILATIQALSATGALIGLTAGAGIILKEEEQDVSHRLMVAEVLAVSTVAVGLFLSLEESLVSRSVITCGIATGVGAAITGTGKLLRSKIGPSSEALGSVLALKLGAAGVSFGAGAAAVMAGASALPGAAIASGFAAIVGETVRQIATEESTGYVGAAATAALVASAAGLIFGTGAAAAGATAILSLGSSYLLYRVVRCH